MNPLTEAASVLLARGPGSPEVFAVRRAPALRFFGGFHAFPGGKVSPADTQAPCRPSVGAPVAPAQAARRITAARELFEETGVLVARRAEGTFPASGPELSALHREMMADRIAFNAVLDQLGLQVWLDDFTPCGTLITPPFTALRFDTAFFVTHLPPGQQPEIVAGELDEGCWTTAGALLDRWLRGECLVSPPTLSILEALRDRPVDEAPERMRPLLAALDSGAMPPIFFSSGVQMVPLRTLALPPLTHTNAYLVGRDFLYLLDPGADSSEEQQQLFAVLDAHRDAGLRLAAVVLTHHHPDHIGAAAVCARRYGVPIWAHPATAQALRGKVVVSREIHDGERLELGTAPDGNGSWWLEALHTPGHAAGHLAFFEPRYRLLFAGDMVSTLSSIIIAPPDGDLAVFLESLRRLLTLDCRLLLPAHGAVSARPRETLEEALAHRVKREEQLLAALAAGPRRVAELVAELYRGLAADLTRFAELQVLAGLQKLQREGRVESDGKQGWRLRSPA
jgi:endoribonuclease LACTB2